LLSITTIIVILVTGSIDKVIVGNFIHNLSTPVSYTISIKAVDIFYNKSIVSNSLAVSTTNNAIIISGACVLL
jgi:hypothetical protein